MFTPFPCFYKQDTSCLASIMRLLVGLEATKPYATRTILVGFQNRSGFSFISAYQVTLLHFARGTCECRNTGTRNGTRNRLERITVTACLLHLQIFHPAGTSMQIPTASLLHLLCSADLILTHQTTGVSGGIKSSGYSEVQEGIWRCRRQSGG